MKTGDVSFCQDDWIVAAIEDFCFVYEINSSWSPTCISLKINCCLAFGIVIYDGIPLTVTK